MKSCITVCKVLKCCRVVEVCLSLRWCLASFGSRVLVFMASTWAEQLPFDLVAFLFNHLLFSLWLFLPVLLCCLPCPAPPLPWPASPHPPLLDLRDPPLSTQTEARSPSKSDFYDFRSVLLILFVGRRLWWSWLWFEFNTRLAPNGTAPRTQRAREILMPH